MKLDIDYQVDNPTYCRLDLKLLNPKTEDPTFRVGYHVDLHFADYLILASKFDAALAQEWNEGTKIRLFYIDAGWFNGVITQNNLKTSLWEGLQVKW